ncbi:hypothetical protein [Pseudonocardia spinosispora]|uniref:hypothetical protein n=1 Tax=Pseudonocardia spinosispora TaxID=103441 RepID=UPI00048B1BF5|nr:hypothetical protein [Pseudonocardia spinosispora]
MTSSQASPAKLSADAFMLGWLGWICMSISMPSAAVPGPTDRVELVAEDRDDDVVGVDEDGVSLDATASTRP